MFARNVFVVLASLVLVTPAFAASRTIQVQGIAATQLIQALSKAGVQSRSGVDTAFFQVSRVSCAEGGGIVSLPMHCSLTDDSTSKEFRTDGHVAMALENAGVKAVSTVMGELHETAVGASKIECNTLFNGFSGCTIEL